MQAPVIPARSAVCYLFQSDPHRLLLLRSELVLHFSLLPPRKPSFNGNRQSEVAEGHGWCCQWKSSPYFGQCYCPSSDPVSDLCEEECRFSLDLLSCKKKKTAVPLVTVKSHQQPAALVEAVFGYQRYLQPVWSDWNWTWRWILWIKLDSFLLE